MSDPDVPRFRVANEGEPVPPVDREDLKRRRKIKPADREASIAAQKQEADRLAVAHRYRMISSLTTFNHGQLLAPWQHGEELDDAVFRLAATFPMRPLRQHVYKVPGDEYRGFDPNAFVEKLIEETGISHTWKPVIARIPEDNTGFSYMTSGTSSGNQGPPDPAREGKQDARDLLWAVWSKCRPDLSRAFSKNHELHVAIVARQFADFAIDNIDLARELVSTMHGGEGRLPLAIMSELERRATRLDWNAPSAIGSSGATRMKSWRVVSNRLDAIALLDCWGESLVQKRSAPYHSLSERRVWGYGFPRMHNALRTELNNKTSLSRPFQFSQLNVAWRIRVVEAGIFAWRILSDYPSVLIKKLVSESTYA